MDAVGFYEIIPATKERVVAVLETDQALAHKQGKHQERRQTTIDSPLLSILSVQAYGEVLSVFLLFHWLKYIMSGYTLLG